VNKKDAFLVVPGHLYPDEGYLLQKLMAGKTVLELGTHHGKSAVAIAATAKFVWTFDTYEGDSMIGAPDYQTAKKSVDEAADNIALKIGDWSDREVEPEVFELMQAEQVDAIFYDAAHEPPHPHEKEFFELVDEVGFRGLIAVHDYKPAEAAMRHVVAAVDEYAKRSGRKMFGPMPGTSIVWFEPF
jgi:predicted O-methyltransferase YrrM